MKKIFLTLFSFTILTSNIVLADETTKPEVLTLFSSQSNSINKVWVGTFQLVFNDMKNKVLKKDISFVGEKPSADLIGLNKEEFKASMLNSSSYYKSYGETSPKAKEKIAKAIKRKFKTNSDVLNSIDWSKGYGKYYAYAMLKKDFKFLKDFDKFENLTFNNSKNKYNFFGINDTSNKELDKNVKVLFYNNENDFAVQLLTKSKDGVYLFRTNKNTDFETLFKEMKNKETTYQGSKIFKENDTLKVPNIVLKEQRKYQELCNKQIKGTDLYFSQAIETIELSLDNKGGKVKSEAILATKCLALAPSENSARHFNFDKTFVLFLIDKNKKDPYLALRIKDLKGLNK